MMESARWLMVPGRRSGSPSRASVIPWMQVTHRTYCMVGNCSGRGRCSASHCSSPSCISPLRPGLRRQSCHSLGLVHRLRSPFPRPQLAAFGRAESGFSPFFRMFCPSFLPLHEVVPACFLGGYFPAFQGRLPGVCVYKVVIHLLLGYSNSRFFRPPPAVGALRRRFPQCGPFRFTASSFIYMYEQSSERCLVLRLTRADTPYYCAQC